MTDEPTAAPTRPTRELWDRVRMTAANAVLAGEWYGPVDAASERIADAVTPLLAGEGTAQPDPPVTVTYTNWQGETAERRIIPERLWYGVTEWHPDPGWLLDATDADKWERRVFALSGFHSDSVLSLTSRASGEGTAPQPAPQIEALGQRGPEWRPVGNPQCEGCGQHYRDCCCPTDDEEMLADLLIEEGMALLAAQAPAEVLWEGPAGQLAAALLGKKPSERGWDPNAVVRVVAADGAPQPEAYR